MDLELKPTEAYDYTVNELEKNLALAEIHAKQYGEDPVFCLDCLYKHCVIIEGLSEEGINFTEDEDKKRLFSKTAELMRIFKSKLKDINERVAFEMADKFRKLRKSLKASPLVQEATFSSSNFPTEKHLNSSNDNLDIDNRGKKMADFRKAGLIVGSQLLAGGIQEAEAYIERPVAAGITLSDVINIGGGLLGTVLVALGRVPTGLELPVAIVSSKLLADGLIKKGKELVPPAPAMARFVPTRVAAPVAVPRGLVKVD